MSKSEFCRCTPKAVAAFLPLGRGTRLEPRFSDAQVIALRKFWTRRRERYRLRDFAKALGTSDSTLSRMLYGKDYAHLPGALTGPITNPTRRRFSIRQVRAMRLEYDPPRVTVADLAKKHGGSASAMSKILSGILYKDVPGAVEILETSPEYGRAELLAENRRRRTVCAEVALFMRLMYRPGAVSAKQIAAAHGAHIDTVYSIIKGETYQDVPGPVHTGTKAEKDKLKRKLTDEQVIEARRAFRAGEKTLVDLKRDLGLEHDPIRFMIYGRTYKELPGAAETPPPRREPPIADDVVLACRRDFRKGKLTVRQVAERIKRTPSNASDLLRGRTYTHVREAVRLSRAEIAELQAQYRAAEKAREDRLLAEGKPLRPLIPVIPLRLPDHDERIEQQAA